MALEALGMEVLVKLVVFIYGVTPDQEIILRVRYMHKELV
jgi:hypothetical protein